MKSKYLEHIEETYKQFELYSIHKHVNNGDYLVLARNANDNYDIGEFVTNRESLAYDIFDKWCYNATVFKLSNINGRYIVIMIYKHNDIYQVVNYCIL